MTTAIALVSLAGGYLDLETAPFTAPGSRILVFRESDGVRVHTSEYERRLRDCRVLDAVSIRDGSGAIAPVSDVLPHRIAFGDVATLTFDGTGALSIAAADGATVELTHPDGSVETHVPGGRGVRIHVRADRSVAVEPGDHAAALARTETQWLEWFARCPIVREDLQPMTAFCWWVLGANIVTLPALGDARAVVPSKIGYVGLWQWDAYFIAVGLRHGDPELAREQLGIAFRFAAADGQLPDVVHEEGVLATSDDLPESDRANLRRAGSQIADPTKPVPMTKPPLAAWALGKVLEVEDRPDWASAMLERVIASQDWWFAESDIDGDGMPEYAHPYSSGLDDSPIFDGPIPTAAPDLASYLVCQDREIAALAAQYLPDTDVTRFLERADRTQALLDDMFDATRGRFLAYGAGEQIVSDTIVGLMPLRTGTLPSAQRDALRAAIDDPHRYALPWGIPTVAASDPDFSAERMWRGPVWVNTAMLVAEGLERSGFGDRARELREQTVRLVIHGGGPHEYYNPETGLKADRATTAFGWSAALFIDLAVTLS